MEIRTVLVIEDSEVLRIILDKVLTQRGFNVLLARGGAEAIKLIESSKIDFIISDLDMPTGDGPTLFAYLREAKIKIPTLVLTGYTDATLESYKAYGIQAVLHKPIESHVIEDIVKFISQKTD